jgi:hypothetical protein
VLVVLCLIVGLAVPGRGVATGGDDAQPASLAAMAEAHAKAGRIEDAASLFEASGRASEARGDLGAALSSGLCARRLRGTMVRPADANGARLEMWMAGVLTRLARPEHAAEAAGRAWTSMVRRLGSDHADTLRCHELLAQARMLQGWLAVAITHYRALHRAAVRGGRAVDAARHAATLEKLSRVRS